MAWKQQHLPLSTAEVKGHLFQEKQSLQSTTFLDNNAQFTNIVMQQSPPQ